MQFSFPAAKILQKLHICKFLSIFFAEGGVSLRDYSSLFAVFPERSLDVRGIRDLCHFIEIFAVNSFFQEIKAE